MELACRASEGPVLHRNSSIPIQGDHIFALAVKVLDRVAPLHGSAIPGVAIHSIRKLVRVLAGRLLRAHLADVRRTQDVDSLRAHAVRRQREISCSTWPSHVG